MDRLIVWTKDNEYCSKLLKEGKELQVEMTQYGKNDFYIDALMQLGLWDKMTDLYPNFLKKENGKPWKTMNGVVAIKELMRLGHISECGKIIGDARLMMAAGFNVEEIIEKAERGEGVVTTDTIRNHLGRIDKESCLHGFYGQVKYIRNKKWIRGHTYVADGHYITIKHGRDYEGAGSVGESYGYKLVVLLNVAEKKERVVGFALGPLQMSERELLKDILFRLEHSVAPVRDIVNTLILDRGYWGAEFLKELKKKWGMDVVTLARDEDLEVSKLIRMLSLMEGLKWREIEETRSHGRKFRVKIVGFEDVELLDSQGNVPMNINVVIAKEMEYEKNGKTLKTDKDGNIIEKEYYYVTTLPGVKRSPYKIRRYYIRRWLIENRFRDMTQQLQLDVLAGHNINAIRSRIAFMLMMFTAEKIIAMKFPGDWQEAAELLKRRSSKGRVDGPGVIIYAPGNKFALYTPREFRKLVQEGDKYKFKERMTEAVAKNITLEEFLKKFT